ncbi:MAG TPA: DUF362 domain-containing protein [Polyangia bacterium]|nr:DUF362 domain-containing protein [Polyangia bacterium]
MFPKVLNARQRFPPSRPVDIAAALASHWPFAIAPGAQIAIAVGSRGIARVAEVARAVIDRVRAAGGHPYIVPAMGSHGGGTAEGQASLLAEYGITEAALGVPIRASMDVQQVATIEDGVPVHLAREAARADGIIAISRVKPHTSFRGPVESGVAKMIAVGLGKRDGATAFHAAADRFGFPRVIEGMARAKLRAAPFLGGVALLEDQHHALAKVAVLRADEIMEREPALLAEAWALMPRLPVREIDLLIVDAIGKNISGAGMDPNVTGRGFAGPAPPGAPPVPTVHRLFARELTTETQGNAIGIGLADFTTTRLVRAIDREATYTNALASLSLRAAKIPIHFDRDRDVITQALATLPLRDPREARVLRIANTLDIETVQLSPACFADGAPPANLEIAGPPSDLTFDGDGNLAPLRAS